MKPHNHPTFAKACEQWLDIENIWTTLGWPDHIHNFNVLWNGGILAMPDCGGRAKKWAGKGARVSIIPVWTTGIIYSQGGWLHDDNSVLQGWNKGYAPVLWSEYASDGVISRSEVFAYLDGGEASRTGAEPLYAWLRLRVTGHVGGLPQEKRTGFNVMVEGIKGFAGMTRRNNIEIDPDTRYPQRLRASAKNYSRRSGLTLIEKGNRVRIGIVPGQDCRVDYSPAAPEGRIPFAQRAWHRLLITVENRVGAHVDVLLPIAPMDKHDYAAVACRGYDAALKETTRYWRRRLKRTVISVPESPINEAIFNSVRFSHMLTERDPATGKLCKINGSWTYNALWATPGAMDLTMLLDTLGYHDRVADYLEIFRDEQGTVTPPGLPFNWGMPLLDPQQDKGAYRLHHGYLSPPARYKAIDWLSDNGAILYALAMHGLLSNDKTYISRFIDTILRSCEWIRDARATSGHEGYAGVLPPAVSSDIGTAVQSVWGVGWNYLGLRKAVKLLRRIGHPRAAEFESERRAFQKEFLAAFRDHVAGMQTWRDGSGKRRKVVPATLYSDSHLEMRHAFFLDAGALFMVFCGLMRANDPIMKDSLAWFRNGPQLATLRRESDCWQVPGLIHEMSSCEPCYSWNLFHSLQSGDREHFLEGLYSLYAGGLSRKTWTSCETRGGVTGNVFTAPLPIYLSRLALLDDTWKEDELHLLRMAPPEWLKHPGLKLDRIPTEHGPVSLEAGLSKNGTRLDISYEPKFFAAPKRVLLHVPRLPGLKETRLNGKRLKGSRVELD